MRKLTTLQMKEIQKLWYAGTSSRKIAKKFNVSCTFVLRHLRKTGINTGRPFHNRYYKITDELRANMSKLWNEGKSTQKIAKILNMSSQTVRRNLIKLGVNTAEGKEKLRKVNEETIKKIEKLRENRILIKDIAKELGLSRYTVSFYIKKMKLPLIRHSHISDNEKTEIKKLRGEDFSSKKIAKRLNLGKSTVLKHLKLMKIDTSKMRTEKVNEVMKTEMKDLWCRGFSLASIGMRFKISDQTVRHWLKRMGFNTSRGYACNKRLAKIKYETLKTVIVAIFKEMNFSLHKMNEFSKHGPDLLFIDSEKHMIPVEFKAEVKYSDWGCKKGIKQIKKYINDFNAPYGFLITTGKVKNRINDAKIKILTAENLLELINKFQLEKLISNLEFVMFTSSMKVRPIKGQYNLLIWDNEN